MADADVVWRRFEKEGCSVRMLHPQRFCDQLWRLVAALEAYLQCPVGCNAYLTPPGTQGFAPHWSVGRIVPAQHGGGLAGSPECPAPATKFPFSQ
jgi:hypothetical protein